MLVDDTAVALTFSGPALGTVCVEIWNVLHKHVIYLSQYDATSNILSMEIQLFSCHPFHLWNVPRQITFECHHMESLLEMIRQPNEP